MSLDSASSALVEDVKEKGDVCFFLSRTHGFRQDADQLIEADLVITPQVMVVLEFTPNAVQ